MTQLGDKLKELRGEATLYEVGQEVGVDRSIISRYERGVIAPMPPLLKKLADYFEVEYKTLRMLYFEDTITEKEEQVILLEWTARKMGYPPELMQLIEQLPTLKPDRQRKVLAELLDTITKSK